MQFMAFTMSELQQFGAVQMHWRDHHRGYLAVIHHLLGEWDTVDSLLDLFHRGEPIVLVVRDGGEHVIVQQRACEINRVVSPITRMLQQTAAGRVRIGCSFTWALTHDILLWGSRYSMNERKKERCAHAAHHLRVGEHHQSTKQCHHDEHQ